MDIWLYYNKNGKETAILFNKRDVGEYTIGKRAARYFRY